MCRIWATRWTPEVPERTNVVSGPDRGAKPLPRGAFCPRMCVNSTVTCMPSTVRVSSTQAKQPPVFRGTCARCVSGACQPPPGTERSLNLNNFSTLCQACQPKARISIYIDTTPPIHLSLLFFFHVVLKTTWHTRHSDKKIN